MKVTALVENTSEKGLPVEHGLSLYIERNNGQKLLFDLGQGDLFAENAKRLGCPIDTVDLCIVSHGHYDHGGGLSTFLGLNQQANVYIHKDAFLPHYSLKDFGLKYIGLDTSLEHNERLMACGDHTELGNGICLFANVHGNCCNPVGNKLLFGPEKTQNDAFGHEQNLVVQEGDKTILFAGCAHTGIVNIVNKASETIGHAPTHIFAGMHLVKSGLPENEENQFISRLANELVHFNCKLFTMHCTGKPQYDKLKALMGERIDYLSCGDSVEL